MQKWISITAFCFGCMAIATSGDAQQPAQAQAGQAQAAQSQAAGETAAQRATPILCVDLEYILDNHPTMKKEIEAINAAATKMNEEFNQKRDQIVARMKALNENYTEGSPEYQREEKAIADADTQFRLEIVRKRKDFDEAKAGVLAAVHSQVTYVVKYYSERVGASVVLRCSRKRIDPKKPQTIEAMGQEVFYYAPNVDISDWVLSALQQQQSAANTATRPAGGSPVNR